MIRNTGMLNFRKSKIKYIVTLILTVSNSEILFSQEIKNGNEAIINLRSENLNDSPVPLEGEWDFYWQELLFPGDDFSDREREKIQIPEAWNKDDRYPDHGYATFRVRVLTPPGPEILGLRMEHSYNHYKLFVNGRLLHQNGIPGREWVRNPENQYPKILILPRNNELEIIVQVSNYYDFYGGILDAPLIGHFETLTLIKNRAEVKDAFLFGVFLAIGFLYILFFLSNKSESRSSLYFGLFALVLALRTILYGEHLMTLLLPGLSVELEGTLGHLTFYIAVPLFLRYISLEHPFRHSHKIEYPFYAVSASYCLLAITTRHSVYINYLIYYQIMVLLVGVIIVSVLVLKTIKKDPAARILLIGFIFLMLTALNDILYSQKIVETFYMISLGLGLFILGQATLLSWRIGRSFLKTRQLSQELSFTNKSFRRFVPEEILNFLNRQRITDIQLGDHVELEMTVMFLDIRDFTSLSEKMTPEENFLFLNSYYKRIGPVIREYNGFIDKYLGDGIMALFSGSESSENAAQAAIRMRENLKLYNMHRSNTGYDPIRVGIGIHTGSLMMGTIGENKRMDGTVISDAVNLGSRIESLTKEYGLNIAMSEESYSRLMDKSDKQVRYIGNIKVKGKEKSVKIYEMFNGDSPELTNLKISTREKFEKAVHLRDRQDYDNARKEFEEVHKLFPHDKTTMIYLSRFRKSDR